MADNINGTLSQSGQMRASLSLEETQLRAQMSDANPSLNAALEQSREFVVPTNFGDLGDVQLTDVQDGQVPKYNSETGKWENANDEAGSDAVWGNIRGTLSDQTDLLNALNSKQNTLVFDNTPTAGSNNPVKSSGIKSALDEKIPTSQKGAANGVATLGSDGKVPSSQLPSISAGVTEEELRDTVGWTGKNLLPYPTGTKELISDQGVITSNSSYYLSDYIDIDNSDSLTFNALSIIGDNVNVRFAFYESNRTFISRPLKTITSASLEVTQNVPSNAKYVRICIEDWSQNKTNSPMLRKASISDSTYEPYHESVKQVLRDGEVIDGKNCMPMTAISQSSNGITITVAQDGSITANGTSTDTAVFILNEYGKWLESNKAYKLCGLYSGSANTYKLDITTQAGAIVSNYDVASFEPTFTVDNSADYRARFVVYSGQTLNNLAIKPMVCEVSESSDYEPYYIPLKDSKFDRSEQRVLGAKNLLPYPYTKTSETSNTVTFTVYDDGSIKINGTPTSGTDGNFYFLGSYGSAIKLLDAGSYIFSCKNLPSGCQIKIGHADTTLYTITSGSDISVTFSLDNEPTWIVVKVLNGTSVSNVTIYPMLRLASDPDDTYVPYAKTNKELTDIVKNVPQEIVRTGVTATAGTAVRIPASGTDSRISTANTCVVKPISDAKSDGTPYKYRSCKVYSGYVEITYAENISNIAVGVEVVNY